MINPSTWYEEKILLVLAMTKIQCRSPGNMYVFDAVGMYPEMVNYTDNSNILTPIFGSGLVQPTKP